MSVQFVQNHAHLPAQTWIIREGSNQVKAVQLIIAVKGTLTTCKSRKKNPINKHKKMLSVKAIVLFSKEKITHINVTMTQNEVTG